MIDRLQNSKEQSLQISMLFFLQKINDLIERVTNSLHPIAFLQSFGEREREKKIRISYLVFIQPKTHLKNILSRSIARF
jgi:hypothetical protein